MRIKHLRWFVIPAQPLNAFRVFCFATSQDAEACAERFAGSGCPRSGLVLTRKAIVINGTTQYSAKILLSSFTSPVRVRASISKMRDFCGFKLSAAM